MNSGGIITAPVSVSDCQQVLGMSYTDVGHICGNVHGKTNKWAKWKPVRYPKLFCQDYDSTKPDFDSTWWRAHDRNCGMDIYPVNTFQALINAYSSGVWGYVPPNGGANAPYRLGDFIRYSHQAKCFIDSVSGVSEIYAQDGDVFLMDANWNNMLDSYSLKTSDFDATSAFNIPASYLGFLIANAGGPLYGITNPGAIDPGYWERVTMPAESILAGDYMLYPFLSSVAMPNRSGVMINIQRLLPLPVAPFQVSVLGDYFIILIINPSITPTPGRLAFALDVRYINYRDMQINPGPIYMKIFQNGNQLTDSQILPSTSVNANSQKDVPWSETRMMAFAPGDVFVLEIYCENIKTSHIATITL